MKRSVLAFTIDIIPRTDVFYLCLHFLCANNIPEHIQKHCVFLALSKFTMNNNNIIVDKRFVVNANGLWTSSVRSPPVRCSQRPRCMALSQRARTCVLYCAHVQKMSAIPIRIYTDTGYRVGTRLSWYIRVRVRS